MRVYNLMWFISWSLRKRGPFCENWSQGSGLIAGCVFWVQVTQMYFLGPRPKDQGIFWDFMILLDSSHDSWENEALFVKIGARVLDLWLDMPSGPKWPKFSVLAQGPKVKTFFEILWFYWINLMIIQKMRSCLWQLG